MKLPPARLVKTMPTIGGAELRAIPREVPRGVAKAKRNMNLKSLLNSNPAFCMAIEILIASANLCTMIEIIRLRNC
jgi:hypothetical protein